MPRKKASATESEQLKKLQETCEKMSEKQDEQEKFIKKILEKMDGRKRKTDDEGLENPAKRVGPALPCKFVLRYVFEDLSEMEECQDQESVIEDHFGVPWSLSIYHENSHLGIYLNCEKSEDVGKWSIDAEYELKIIHPNGKSVTKNVKHTFHKNDGYGYPEFLKWEDLRNYTVDDKLIVEAHATINKVTGIRKENLRSFDETMNDVSDIVLIVQDEKFFVSKLFLATHSSFFKAMFLGRFDESKKSEIKLSDINSEDFQKYLEVLYGEAAIDEVTVEGILLIADMFDTSIVTRKCEDFLLKESKTVLAKNFEMSIRYNLEKLKEKCLSEIKTIEDIRSVISDDIKKMDPSISNILLEKALSLK